MRFRLTLPTRVLVDREVTYVQAEDSQGRFGILKNHEPFLTALVPSIVVYRYREGGAERESYAAVREGVLRVSQDTVQAAVRDGEISSDLAGLEEAIRKTRRKRNTISYRSTRSLYQMQLTALRRLMEFEDVRTK